MTRNSTITYRLNETACLTILEKKNSPCLQRYTYRVLQTIQIELILLCVWAEPAATLKFK